MRACRSPTGSTCPRLGLRARRARAGVPDAVVFEAKAAIALGQMRQALADGVPAGVARGDAA